MDVVTEGRYRNRSARQLYARPSASKGRDIALDRMRYMVAATETIAEYVHRGRTAFDEDAAIRDAILYQIIVIGEDRAPFSLRAVARRASRERPIGYFS